MRRVLYISLLCGTLVACGDDVATTDAPAKAVRIEGYIGTETATRAVGATWNNADQIGVSGSGKDNVLYSTTSTTTSADFTSTTPIYYTAPPSYYDAYYPYQSSPTTHTAATTAFAVATNPAANVSETARKAIDVLWARTSGAVAAGSNVVFNFSHMLAELVITFDWTGTGFGSAPTSWDFAIGSVYQSATVTLSHSQLSAGSWSVPTCAVAASGSASAYSVAGWKANTYTMIVPAQDLSAHALSVTTGGVTYSGTLPASFSLTQGNKSTVTIKVSKTGLSVTSATVSPWGDGAEASSTPISATL